MLLHSTTALTIIPKATALHSNEGLINHETRAYYREGRTYLAQNSFIEGLQ